MLGGDNWVFKRLHAVAVLLLTQHTQSQTHRSDTLEVQDVTEVVFLVLPQDAVEVCVKFPVRGVVQQKLQALPLWVLKPACIYLAGVVGFRD